MYLDALVKRDGAKSRKVGVTTDRSWEWDCGWVRFVVTTPSKQNHSHICFGWEWYNLVVRCGYH